MPRIEGREGTRALCRRHRPQMLICGVFPEVAVGLRPLRAGLGHPMRRVVVTTLRAVSLADARVGQRWLHRGGVRTEVEG